MGAYYIDTCIWLNLFKKEGTITRPYWRYARDFLNNQSQATILSSGFVMRELKFKLSTEEYAKRKHHMRKITTYIAAQHTDITRARTIESASKFTISFYDCLHIAICLRLNATLVTRDKLLLEHAEQYITAKRPEDLLT